MFYHFTPVIGYKPRTIFTGSVFKWSPSAGAERHDLSVGRSRPDLGTVWGADETSRTDDAYMKFHWIHLFRSLSITILSLGKEWESDLVNSLAQFLDVN
jgi:hypothetical protein